MKLTKLMVPIVLAILPVATRADITQHVWKFPTLSPYDLTGKLMTNPKNWNTSILPNRDMKGDIWVDRDGKILLKKVDFVTAKPADTVD